MSKLLAVGCSYTFYEWPTWADYLAGNFTHYHNKGIPGCDNAIIARNIVSVAEPGDTVVAMWSSYERYNHKITYDSLYQWRQGIHAGIDHIKHKEYFADIYNQFERFTTTLDYIQWTISDSINRNYKLVNLTAFPLLAGELNSPVTEDMTKLINEKQWYLDQINQTDLYTFAADYKKRNDDWHPPPLAHYDFADQIICPLLAIDAMQTTREQAIKDTIKCLTYS